MTRFSGSGGNARAGGLLVAGALAALALGLPSPAQAGTESPDAAASAKGKAGPEIENCARHQRATRRGTGRDRARAQRRLDACRTQNAANRKVFDEIKNSKFVGVRGDGARVDHTFCANGKYEARTTSFGSTGVNKGTSWQVADARVRLRGQAIDAEIRDRRRGLAIAIAKRGRQWKIGIAFGGSPNYGNVEKSDARSICAKL